LRVCYLGSGYCEEVYKQGPCGAGEWLVLSADGRPHCQLRDCEEGYFMFKSSEGRKCVKQGELSCDGGKEPLILGSGELECVCPDGYYSAHGDCKKLEKCRDGQHLSLNHTGQVTCSDNILTKALISSLPSFYCPPPRYYRSYTGACKRRRYMRMYNYYKIQFFGRNRNLNRTRCSM